MSSKQKLHRISPVMQRLAAENRGDASHPERALWSILRRSQLNGLKFRRQHVVGPYIADFCCPKRKLIIEVDGESHVGCSAPDLQRERFLVSEGYRVLRVTNDDELQNIAGVAHAIVIAAGETDVHLSVDGPPTPIPPPSEGGGKGAQCPQ